MGKDPKKAPNSSIARISAMREADPKANDTAAVQRAMVLLETLTEAERDEHNAEHAAVPAQRAYFVGIHPYHFQSGTPAEILGVKMVRDSDKTTYHPAYHLRFPDGREDYAPIQDRDHVGECGLGVSYKIVSHDERVRMLMSKGSTTTN